MMPRLLATALLIAIPIPAQGATAHGRIHLRYGVFDPSTQRLALPTLLRGDETTALWIVQFHGAPTESRRASLRAAGGEVHGFLPENAYVVRMSHAVAAEVRRQRGVRSATPYHPAFRIDPAVVKEYVSGEAMQSRRYNIVVVDKTRDKPALVRHIEAIGGVVSHQEPGSILLQATLSREQLIRTACFDEVLWIDRWTPVELDMNNARIQGGANHVRGKGRYTGRGITGHVYEGIEATHVDFTNKPVNVDSCGSASSHGHCTAGIIFGNGKSHANALGLAPDAQPFYTTFTCVSTGKSRWQVTKDLVTTHKVMFTSASWGSARTRFYTSISADTDNIIFDHDIPWTQAHSDSAKPEARPESWAKNVYSIGGVKHFDNANPLDDSWKGGGSSTGPALDGRIKPDLVGYYDEIWTSDLTGSAGYSSTQSYWTSFGGSSGATPMVAGHNALAIQMFTDGLFGNKLRKPTGTRFENRPHFTTLKALQIANAAQYAFTSTSTDNRREHVGWGFPDLKTAYDMRNAFTIVDETDVLKQGTGMAYTIQVANNTPLKISMVYSDLAANPSATITRVNDLSLRVTAPGGTRYWGNFGLVDGNFSVPGGYDDQRDTVENVFVQRPAGGRWIIEVLAVLVAKDSHVETTAVDADFGLVVRGGTFVSKRTVPVDVGSFTTFGTSCPGSTKTPRLRSSGIPTLGRTLPVALDEARASALAVLLIGASNTAWTGGSLPFPLSVLGGGTCKLYVSPDILVFYGTNATGHTTALLPMPTNASTLGALAHIQFAIDDPPATNFGIVTTNAATLRLGN